MVLDKKKGQLGFVAVFRFPLVKVASKLGDKKPFSAILSEYLAKEYEGIKLFLVMQTSFQKALNRSVGQKKRHSKASDHVTL